MFLTILILTGFIIKNVLIRQNVYQTNFNQKIFRLKCDARIGIVLENLEIRQIRFSKALKNVRDTIYLPTERAKVSEVW